MIGLISFLLVLSLSSPALAFVEQLGPNGGPIPCHGMGALLRYFISPGGPSAAALGNLMAQKWLPGGWTSTDNADNAALVSELNSRDQEGKERLVQRVEDFCIIWELGFEQLNTPAEYRQFLEATP